MIANFMQKNQLPEETKAEFDELHVLKHLRQAGIVKSFGFSCATLFQLVFRLIFTQKNWFRLLESNKAADLPGKDTVYRFLNYPKFAWRRFLLALSVFTITKVSRLTRASHNRVLIVDDSSFYRDRSKKVELLTIALIMRSRGTIRVSEC